MTNNKKNKRITSDEQVKLYETITPLLLAAYNEIKELSKQKQDDTLNVGKVKTINRLLIKAKEILKDESTVSFLDLLDQEPLPSNSDTLLIMSQYLSALEKFHADHYVYDNMSWRWDNEG